MFLFCKEDTVSKSVSGLSHIPFLPDLQFRYLLYLFRLDGVGRVGADCTDGLPEYGQHGYQEREQAGDNEYPCAERNTPAEILQPPVHNPIG